MEGSNDLVALFKKYFRRDPPESPEEIKETQPFVDEYLGRIHGEYDFRLARAVAGKFGYKTYPNRFQDYVFKVKGDLSASSFERVEK